MIFEIHNNVIKINLPVNISLCFNFCDGEFDPGSE